MSRVRTSTLLIAMILLAVAAALWLIPKGYGITLRFEGTKLVIDGKEVCKDVVGSVIIKFGNEFHSINVCELIERKAIYVSFSEGVKYWMETLEELGIKTGMSAEKVLATLEGRGYGGVAMPTVSVTFWLIGEDVHYIANYAFTSLDYYYYMRGYDYFKAFNKMLENPLAIVEKRATIIIRSEDLAKKFAVINMSRALDEVREELNLSEPISTLELHNLVTTQSDTTQTDCPPGWQSMSSLNGICMRENYWNLSTTPPDFFSERVIYNGNNRDEVIQDMWDWFLWEFTYAYLFDKGQYPTLSDVMARLTSSPIASSDCTRALGKPFNMSYVLQSCLLGPINIDWQHVKAPGTEFTIYKPFVVTFVSSMSNIPPLAVLLTYGTAQAGFKRTGFSIMGIPIFPDQGYSLDQDAKAVVFTNVAWANGVRRVALIVPTYMKYLHDALIFTWNIREYGAYVNGVFRRYWLAEPVPIITPYYKEIGWASRSDWGRCYYDADSNLKGGDGFCVPNINIWINNMAGTFERDYHLIKATTFNNIPVWSWELLDTSRFNTTEEYGYLGSITFGIVKTLVVDLFLGSIAGPYRPFLLFLNFIDYEDTTFTGSAVVQYLEWHRYEEPSDIPVMVEKITKSGSYLSKRYSEIGKRPLAVEYVVIIGAP